MRAYGLPRIKDIESPDIVDIQCYALKSSTGRFRERGGDFRGYLKNKSSKNRIRRIFKKRIRRELKNIDFLYYDEN